MEHQQQAFHEQQDQHVSHETISPSDLTQTQQHVNDQNQEIKEDPDKNSDHTNQEDTCLTDRNIKQSQATDLSCVGHGTSGETSPTENNHHQEHHETHHHHLWTGEGLHLQGITDNHTPSHHLHEPNPTNEAVPDKPLAEIKDDPEISDHSNEEDSTATNTNHKVQQQSQATDLSSVGGGETSGETSPTENNGHHQEQHHQDHHHQQHLWAGEGLHHHLQGLLDHHPSSSSHHHHHHHHSSHHSSSSSHPHLDLSRAVAAATGSATNSANFTPGMNPFTSTATSTGSWTYDPSHAFSAQFAAGSASASGSSIHSATGSGSGPPGHYISTDHAWTYDANGYPSAVVDRDRNGNPVNLAIAVSHLG